MSSFHFLLIQDTLMSIDSPYVFDWQPWMSFIVFFLTIQDIHLIMFCVYNDDNDNDDDDSNNKHRNKKIYKKRFFNE